MSSKVIFKGKTYPTLTALAKKLGKTVNQIGNHLYAGTPVLGHKRECIDYLTDPEDFLELADRNENNNLNGKS